MKNNEKKVEVEKEHTECCCGGKCKCEDNKKHYLKVFIVSFVGMFLFLGGLITGAILLYNSDLVLEEKNGECDSKKENVKSEEYAYKIIMDRIDKLAKIEHLSRDINNVSELTNQEMLQFAANYVETNKKDYSFTLEDVNKITMEYFGRIVEGEDINCTVTVDEEAVYLFDKENGIFRINDNHSGHGGGHFSDVYVLNRVEDFVFDGSKYIVKVKKAFSSIPDTGFATYFYCTYEDFLNDKNLLFEVEILESENGNYFAYPEIEFANIQDEKMYTFEYVFEKKENNYVLVSYKIEK